MTLSVICILLLFVAVIVILMVVKPTENYRKFTDYHIMARLPWVTPPTGIGALGEYQAKQMKRIYPGLRFQTADIPISCPSRCNVTRIYETGNTFNPNTYNYIGHIGSEDISY